MPQVLVETTKKENFNRRGDEKNAPKLSMENKAPISPNNYKNQKSRSALRFEAWRFSSNSNYLTKMWVAPECKVFIDSMRYSKSTLNACHVSSVHVVERKMEGMKQSLLHYLLLCNPRSFVVNFIFHQNTVFVLASNFLCKARNTGNQRTKQWKNFFGG